jgi:hypothetical protein
MAIPNVYPTVFGDFDSRDLMERTAAEVPQPELYDQIQKVLALYSELAKDVISILAVTDTIAKESYAALIPGGGADTGIMQVRGEFGRVLATRIAQEQAAAESAFEVGYPIHQFGDRAMFSPEYLLRATVRDINNKTVDALIRDYNFMFRSVLQGVFDNNNYSFRDDKVLGQGLGVYEVKRLLNADGIPGLYRREDGQDVALGTVNHYKVSGTAGFTNGTFSMAHDALTNIGMDTDIVYFISKSNEQEVRLLTDFVPFDPPTNVANADPRIIDPPVLPETIPPPPPRSIVRSPRSIGRIRSADGNSGEVIVLPWMFHNYLFAMDRAADRPVMIRESDLAQLRGFRFLGENNLTPEIGGDKLIHNKYWSRIFGVGVRNRANGVIVQITQNAQYTPPQMFLM